MIIFDFDQTLVDTQPVEHLRVARNWRAVMAQASNLKVYDGIHELLQDLQARGHRLAIVTKSPDMVAKAFIREHAWPIDIVVGYHQVKQRKPHPEGLLLAMKQAGARPCETFHIGDQAQDTEASRAAGVIAIGSAWGIDDVSGLAASKPDQLFSTIAELTEFLASQAAPKT